MARPHFTPNERHVVYNKTNGNCYHCREPITFDCFHIDHHPIPFKDLRDQLYIPLCGNTTDARDITNLQPSCRACNVSHAHERRRWYWCGHAQLRIRKTIVYLGITHVTTLALGYVLGYALA